MAKNKRRANKRHHSKSRSKIWSVLMSPANKKRLLLVSLLSLVVGIPYIWYLDREIRTQFEGKRWAIPAKVYARPLELYPEVPINAGQFEQELKILAYRNIDGASKRGSYQRNKNHFLVHTREFSFWDGKEQALRLRLDFSGNQLLSLRHADSGIALPLVRLDPGIIGRIYPSHNEDRILVKIDEVPKLLIDALTLVEDRDFFSHWGVSPKSIARAMLANIRAGGTVQGGSTLTQQLVKNFFLTNERSLWRKANEAVMALLLEWHYDKREILEAYLNEIYLGQDGHRAIHGFGLASQFYFDRSIDELSPAQISLLVALVKGASYYSPRRRPERSKARRDLVINLLQSHDIISASIAESAKQEPLGVSERARSSVSSYPAFIDLVRRQLRRDYRDEDLNSEGLQIFTTLDPLLQETTERSFSAKLTQLGLTKDLPNSKLQAAGVVVSIDGGEVLAIIGGRNPRFSGFNRAMDAVRPIGSLIKPAVYLTALMQPEKYTLATLIDDGPLRLEINKGNVWTPQNFDKKSHGFVPLHTAMAKSYNLSTARLGLELGLENVIETLKKLGVKREMKPYPSMLLGSLALSPLEVTQMYHTLASGGFRTPLRAIRAILDAQGEPLQRYPLSVEKVFSDQEMYLIQWIMKEVARSGTARAVYQYLPKSIGVGGKTGTSNDLRDSWFGGFTGDRLAVVWVGMDNNQSAGLTGSRGALRIWADVMQKLNPQATLDIMPEGIEMAAIDNETQLRAGAGCAEIVSLPFIIDSEPPLAPCAGGTGMDAQRPIVTESGNRPVSRKPWYKSVF
ncbi:MAG: penicillin-binding protein 1B [Thiohalomonadales bacterium]